MLPLAPRQSNSLTKPVYRRLILVNCPLELKVSTVVNR